MMISLMHKKEAINVRVIKIQRKIDHICHISFKNALPPLTRKSPPSHTRNKEAIKELITARININGGLISFYLVLMF